MRSMPWDVQMIITSVIEAIENVSNPTKDVFQAIYRSSIRCYLGGRKIVCSPGLLAELMGLMYDDAEAIEHYSTFCHWVNRVHEDTTAKALLDWDEDGS